MPFDIKTVLDKLMKLNEVMVTGAGNREKQDPYHGKLSCLIGRLEAKWQADTRCSRVDWGCLENTLVVSSPTMLQKVKPRCPISISASDSAHSFVTLSWGLPCLLKNMLYDTALCAAPLLLVLDDYEAIGRKG